MASERAFPRRCGSWLAEMSRPTIYMKLLVAALLLGALSATALLVIWVFGGGQF